MNKELVSDELWRIVVPLLPTDRGKPGSKRHVTKSVGVRGFTAPLHQPPLWC
jgi:transposase